MDKTDVDEIVFQILVGRMAKKKRFARPITQREILGILSDVRDVLCREPVMLELAPPMVIVGDIHGNIDDLIRIFERLRYPPANRFLFLGDYVDRGENGIEVMLLLMALKIKFPENVFLLRGNHESGSLTKVYGFEEEALQKYDKDIYNAFVDTFFELPLSARVGSKIFCVHGGISPELINIEDLNKVQKPKEIPSEGVFSDLVWSDPDPEVKYFKESRRGCGFLYGPEALDEFLSVNKLDLLVRSHEVCENGIDWPFADDERDFGGSCITIFSNTDYCGYPNKGAVLVVSERLEVTIEMFDPLSEIMPGNNKKHNVLMPYWLSEFIQKKEAERIKKNSRRNSTPNVENVDTNDPGVEPKVPTVMHKRVLHQSNDNMILPLPSVPHRSK